jgi:DNA-binding beta-propeller fold protein YncE
MEIKLRMSKRFAWLLGVVGLVSLGLLVACGSKYNSSSDGLVLVSSQGSNVIQAFSFGLNSGSISGISNPPATNGQPFSIVLDPAGAYAYVASTVTCTPNLTGNSSFTNVSLTAAAQAAITAYKVNSNGTLSAKGSAQYLQGNPAYPTTGTSTPALPDFPACGLDDSTNPNPGNALAAVFMDSSGKFLFVATLPASVIYSYTDNTNPQSPVNRTATATLPGAIQVFSIGSDATLTAVPGSFTFTLPMGFQMPTFVALAATPTVFPALGLNGQQNAVCSAVGNNPPTTEFLYVADSANNVVWEFKVNTASGALMNPPNFSAAQPFSTGAIPLGVAVDPCDRFVYVSNWKDNTVSAFTICNGNTTQDPSCPKTPAGGDGSLVTISGSPFSASGGANGPGPLAVDPFGNTVYVVDTDSSMISVFRISPVSGKLSAGSPATVATGAKPTSIAVRSDDNWLFVTNFNAGTLSQYSITPATGALSPEPSVTTDNYPWGVAVK